MRRRRNVIIAGLLLLLVGGTLFWFDQRRKSLPENRRIFEVALSSLLSPSENPGEIKSQLAYLIRSRGELADWSFDVVNRDSSSACMSRENHRAAILLHALYESGVRHHDVLAHARRIVQDKSSGCNVLLTSYAELFDDGGANALPFIIDGVVSRPFDWVNARWVAGFCRLKLGEGCMERLVPYIEANTAASTDAAQKQLGERLCAEIRQTFANSER